MASGISTGLLPSSVITREPIRCASNTHRKPFRAGFNAHEALVARPNHPQRGRRLQVAPRAVAEKLSGSTGEDPAFDIGIDNDADESATVISVTGLNRPGLLSALTAAFRDLNLEVVKVGNNTKFKLCITATVSWHGQLGYKCCGVTSLSRMQASVGGSNGQVADVFYVTEVQTCVSQGF